MKITAYDTNKDEFIPFYKNIIKEKDIFSDFELALETECGDLILSNVLPDDALHDTTKFTEALRNVIITAKYILAQKDGKQNLKNWIVACNRTLQAYDFESFMKCNPVETSDIEEWAKQELIKRGFLLKPIPNIILDNINFENIVNDFFCESSPYIKEELENGNYLIWKDPQYPERMFGCVEDIS